MFALLFYVALAVGVLLCWAGMFWAVSNEHERRERERQAEELRVAIEKLQLTIGKAPLPSFAKMAEAFAAAAVSAQRASLWIREAATALEKHERKGDE